MKKNGFTLIELLAVIIILGILMIIAIPSVTKYISDSRKSAYVDTAKEIIGGARNIVNGGKLEMYDTDTTYYIESSCIKTENALKSPYGDFTKAYVVVTYDGKGYDYYWTSVDDAGQGVKNITSLDSLDVDDIESDLTRDDIVNTLGVNGRHKYVHIDKTSNCNKGTSYIVTDNVNTNSNNSNKPICIRVTNQDDLHRTTCSNNYCSSLAGSNNELLYGNAKSMNSSLSTGDAFNCDVNGDGVYDSATERFYFVSYYYDVNTLSFDDTYATLIYYSNYLSGQGATLTGTKYSDAENVSYGPNYAVNYLPSTSEWKNVSLKTNTRQILAEYNSTHNATSTSFSSLPSNFSYEGRSARLITAQEIMNGCGLSSVGSFTRNELNSCSFLCERTRFESYDSSYVASSVWFETPHASKYGQVWVAKCDELYVSYYVISQNNNVGIHPAIDVPISKIQK